MKNADGTVLIKVLIWHGRAHAVLWRRSCRARRSDVSGDGQSRVMQVFQGQHALAQVHDYNIDL